MKRIAIRALVVFLILILSLSLVSGCNLLPDLASSPPSSPAATENTAPEETSPSTIPAATNNATPIDSEWSIPISQSQAPPLPGIADVVAQVKPSVVAINTEVITLDFFNRPFTQEGAGSGWIIREDGIIITNNHVIEGAKSITVTLDDGRTFPVDLNTVATDEFTDLAILKIDAENLPAATVGDSTKLRVGDWVVAIGNALGEGTSATNGIVSRKEARITVGSGQTLYDLIQTNAAINPGNSGGPLVNMAGEVIGITSAKIAAAGVEGMGYAISSNEAMPIIKDLITIGYVVRPWLGVNLYSVDLFVIQRYNLTVDKGALIVYIAAGSPADKAGLREGDVITQFEDQEITDVDDLIIAIRSSQVGQKVAITYWRGEVKKTTSATLIESPPPQ